MVAIHLAEKLSNSIVIWISDFRGVNERSYSDQTMHRKHKLKENFVFDFIYHVYVIVLLFDLSAKTSTSRISSYLWFRVHLKSNTTKRINTANGYWSRLWLRWYMARSYASTPRYKWKRSMDLVLIFIFLKTWNKIDNCPVESTAQRTQGYYNIIFLLVSVPFYFCLSLDLPNENHFVLFFFVYDKSQPHDRGNRRLTKYNNKLPVESKRQEEKYIKHKTGLNWKRKRKKTNTSTRSRRHKAWRVET